MVRRSHKWRKRFVCGHRGYGRWCHRCADSKPHLWVAQPQKQVEEQSEALSRIHRKAAKRRWQQRFLYDPIPLKHLPKPVVLKTRFVLAALEQGTPPSALQGKRLRSDRTLLRIPVTYRYRLLCRWQNGHIIPLMVLSHEAYNAIARNKKQVKQG